MGIKKDRLRSLSIIGFLESGRQDSNLRPSAPKALGSILDILEILVID